MCNTCGKKAEEKSSKTVDSPRVECNFCGGIHQAEETEPYVDPFPQIPAFPKEGIYGMYPIRSTCKRAIMEHLLRFERELIAQGEKAKMRVKMIERTNAMQRKEESDDPTSRIVSQLDQLDADIQQLKHELTVEYLRRKYNAHSDDCPRSEP